MKIKTSVFLIPKICSMKFRLLISTITANVKYKKRSVFKVVNFQTSTKPILWIGSYISRLGSIRRIGVLSMELCSFLTHYLAMFSYIVCVPSMGIFTWRVQPAWNDPLWARVVSRTISKSQGWILWGIDWRKRDCKTRYWRIGIVYRGIDTWVSKHMIAGGYWTSIQASKEARSGPSSGSNV